MYDVMPSWSCVHELTENVANTSNEYTNPKRKKNSFRPKLHYIINLREKMVAVLGYLLALSFRR